MIADFNNNILVKLNNKYVGNNWLTFFLVDLRYVLLGVQAPGDVAHKLIFNQWNVFLPPKAKMNDLDHKIK